jgi:diguanylate cyclase (GGDEF)-like protein
MAQESWLIKDGIDRERMLDMDRRLQPVRRTSFAILAVALVACGPWLGWWTMIPLGIAAVVFKIADDRMDRVPRPEYGLFAAWAASQVILGASVALSGGPSIPTMAWFAIPAVTLSARFSGRGIIAGVGVTLALMVAVAFGVDAHAVIDNPTLLIAPAALVLAVTVLSTALMQSDVQHRNEVVLDPLTSTLNRKALTSRVAELTEQAGVTGEPIGIALGDLDHFKRINDSCGHAVGDAVLKDVAYLLRKELRAFDLIYRIGGEEFLLLLPGADLEHTEAVAEELREAVRCKPVGGGQRVTMSFGVAASERGEAFDYDAVFEQADAGLYDAKRCGRDRTCKAPEEREAALALA